MPQKELQDHVTIDDIYHVIAIEDFDWMKNTVIVGLYDLFFHLKKPLR